MRRKYEPKPYSSQGNLDSDTELVSWISDGMQKLSRYMQMEECEGVMQYKETFYTYFQRKYGACASANYFINTTTTTTIPITPIQLSNTLLSMRPKSPLKNVCGSGITEPTKRTKR